MGELAGRAPGSTGDQEHPSPVLLGPLTCFRLCPCPVRIAKAAACAGTPIPYLAAADGLPPPADTPAPCLSIPAQAGACSLTTMTSPCQSPWQERRCSRSSGSWQRRG